ncbi:MAG: DUF72 domain-containing protein [Armatimonadota bacterium]|nr:MAG: DUF72 domain-containing protein [Armatimonadota bacterium]
MTAAWVGISGFSYSHWQGVFYPTELPKARWRDFAISQYNAVELNASFYGTVAAETWARYRETRGARAFRWAVKGNRFITHITRLQDRVPLANFFASGVLELRDTLGPILWQLPPGMEWQPDVFQRFLDWLPRDSDAAQRLARHHDDKVKAPCVESAHEGPLAHAMEVRSRKMIRREMFDMLAERGVGFVLTDSAGNWPYAEEITSDIVYCRLHGHDKTYISRYTDAQLDWWAERARAWMAGKAWDDPVRATDRATARRRREVYFFFDNDGEGHAPFDARRLAERLDAVPPTAEGRDSFCSRAPHPGRGAS